MNAITIAGLIVATTFLFYVVFIGIGLIGVSKNRKAQGLEKISDE